MAMPAIAPPLRLELPPSLGGGGGVGLTLVPLTKATSERSRPRARSFSAREPSAKAAFTACWTACIGEQHEEKDGLKQRERVPQVMREMAVSKLHRGGGEHAAVAPVRGAPLMAQLGAGQQRQLCKAGLQQQLLRAGLQMAG